MHAQVMSNQGQKKLHGVRPVIYENSHKVAMYQCHQVGLTRCFKHWEFDHFKEDRGGGDGRIERKTKPKRCEDMVNLFTRHDSWQMAPSITKFSLSPNLPELGISILTMSTMGSYYTIGNYVEGRLLYHQTVFLMYGHGVPHETTKREISDGWNQSPLSSQHGSFPNAKFLMLLS